MENLKGEFKLGNVETKIFSSPSKKMLNYVVQAQNCDIAAQLTEEMNKYPKGSPERQLLKAIRFGIAYGRGDQIININTDYSPQELMARFRAMLKKGESNE